MAARGGSAGPTGRRAGPVDLGKREGEGREERNKCPFALLREAKVGRNI